jgi:hypothetical protein
MQGPDFNIPMESLMKVQNSRIVLKQGKSRDEYMRKPQVLDGERKAIRRVSELIIIESKQEDKYDGECKRGAINPSPAKKAQEFVAISNLRYGMPITTRRCLVNKMAIRSDSGKSGLKSQNFSPIVKFNA